MNDLTVTVRFFAGQRTIVGSATLRQTIGAGSRVEELWQQLIAAYPALAPYRTRMLIARNQEFCALDAELHDGDEIAFIPPVSGGRTADR